MDARLFEQFAGGGGAQRFVSSVERAGDGLPETRLVGPLDEQYLQVGGVDDDEDGFGDFVRHTVAYRKPGTGTCCLSPILFTGWSKRGQAASASPHSDLDHLGFSVAQTDMQFAQLLN